MTRLSGDWPLERRLGKGDWACGYSVSGNCLCAGSGLSAADTRLALPPAAVGRTAVERRAARRDASPHRTAVERRSYQANFAKYGGGETAAFHAAVVGRPGGSAGHLAPSGDGQKGDK